MAGAKPKATEQNGGLYDVVIQLCMARDRARGMPVIVDMYEPGRAGVVAWSQG